MSNSEQNDRWFNNVQIQIEEAKAMETRGGGASLFWFLLRSLAVLLMATLMLNKWWINTT